MPPEKLFQIVSWFIPVVLSLTVHEWAHAASASALGDDTAERDGRLTLNPVVHLDPVGTLLVPLMQILMSGGVMFAWAKPVPVNPARFRRSVTMSLGSVIVSAAGPASNLLLALGAAVGMGLSRRFGGGPEGALVFLETMFAVNIGLAVFNLVPIPPLDGSKVLHGLLPTRAALVYERIFPYAPFVLMGFLLLGGGFLGIPMALVASLFEGVAALVAG